MNDETLTKVRALEITRDLFGWLAGAVVRDKEEWPGWSVNGGNVDPCNSDCACCEYAARQSVKQVVDCSLCPLKEFWPDGNCCDPKSPYILWRECGRHPEQALRIRDGAIAALEKEQSNL